MRGQRRATRAVLPAKVTRGQGRSGAYHVEQDARAANLPDYIARAERGEPLFAKEKPCQQKH